MKRTILAMAITGFAIIVLATLASEAQADTIIVDSGGNGDYTTIQDAVDHANDGDTIRIWGGVYNENVVIGVKIDIEGNSTATVIVDGGASGSVIEVISDWVNITKVTARNSMNNTGLYGGILVNGVGNVTVEDCFLTENRNGIIFLDSVCCAAQNINATRNWVGVDYTDTSYTSVFSSQFWNNQLSGVDPCGGGHNNISNNVIFNSTNGITFSMVTSCEIWNNTIFNGTYGSYGIYAVDCDNFTIAENSFSIKYGMYLRRTNDCHISNNTVDSGRRNIVLTDNCCRNIICWNTISNAGQQGIRITYQSNGNIIFRNNFINNVLHVYQTLSTNFWNSSLPNGGNYWDNWTTPDENGDGIVDNPHVVYGGVTDYYPWALESGWPEEVEEDGEETEDVFVSLASLLVALLALLLLLLIIKKTLQLVQEELEEKK